MEKWITANQLLKRWSVAPAAIFEAVEQGLPTYREWTPGKPKKVDMKDFFRHFSRMHGHSEVKNWFPVILFKMSDIASFEDEHPEKGFSMTANERRNNGPLKPEREKFTAALSATVKGLIHCQSQKAPIRKAEFKNFIQKACPGLSVTSIGEIWRAIPRKHKLSGRPRLSPEK
jgi:hypothetical protein